MSWGLGWKRASEIFHLTLDYGDSGDNADDQFGNSLHSLPPEPRHSSDKLGFQIDLEWSAADDEEQVALRLQSQLMVALPPPQDTVLVDILENGDESGEELVGVLMKVMKRREPLRAMTMHKAAGSGQQSDGVGVLTRLLRSNLASSGERDGLSGFAEHWRSLTALNLCGCGLTVLPIELMKLSLLEKLYLDNNKLAQLPPELGELRSLKVLRVDNNILVSVPVELRQCVMLVELSLEHNKLVRPLLDFRAMSELRVLRLYGNPLEFLPEILPLHNLRHLSLANIRIEATENLKTVDVQIETDNGSYFSASRHKLSPFFSLIFRFSSCHHPLLASALAKLMRDQNNGLAISKEENAVRQLISMISSDNRYVVEQACSALSSLASNVSLAMQLIKSDIMQPIESALKSVGPEELISLLHVMVNLAFASDNVAQKMLTKDVLKSLKGLCAYKNMEVQRLALLVVGNLAFCLENRRTLVQSESLRELLLRLAVAPEPRVNKAAARALAILGENESLRKAIRGRPIGKQGLRILCMDGGGMKGLATVQMLKQVEQGTGKAIHELFDLICGTSTGGMLAIALGVKQMTLDQCEEIYKELGKLVFTDPIPKDNEAASWREKLDQLYKSSSQSFRVVVHGSKHSADQFEKLLKEMCADEDGDLLIDSAVKKTPKVFVVSTLVSVTPAQPFIFRNYQYPVGTPELPSGMAEGLATSGVGAGPVGQRGSRRCAYMGTCKHRIWEAIRASSAAPYYLDDFSDDVNRWQDGAIVANNPTIFAVREAQLLWPDTRIDCLVSIGCGSVPTKVRKGGWRYLDTGQVLIESACSVERVEETMDTLMPLLPDMQYFRFNPVDERCGMELDETDPAIWLKLEAATSEYIQKNSQAFGNLFERLLSRYADEERMVEKLKIHHLSNTKHSSAVHEDESPLLGWRRMVLLVESSHNPDSGKKIYHARALEAFCVRIGIKLSLTKRSSGFSKPTTAFPTPFTSPLLTGSFPSSPLVYSPEGGSQRMSHIDLVPPLSLDGHPTGKATSPTSPLPSRQPSINVLSLNEKLQNLPQVGIIHLALQNDSTGLILSWQNDVFVVAEPGELADKFLRSVKLSLSTMMRVRKRKDLYSLSKVVSISELVAHWRQFEVGGILHRYIGRQTQVMEDNQEIAAYMFRRTLPAIHLTSEDVRWMVGSWRDRIIICTGKCGPTPGLVKSFLDMGAKCVIASSLEPPDAESVALYGAGEYGEFENGKFVIGDEEGEDGESEPSSPASDWEDSDAEKSGLSDLDEGDEEELSKFVRVLYDMLFREGATVSAALNHALSSHPKLSGEKSEMAKPELFELSNGTITVRLTNVGASINSLLVPDSQGNIADVVLGFDSLDAYVNDNAPYFGCIVGRVANRIKDGKFTLNGHEFFLPINNGPNSIHGGNKGFNKVLWETIVHKDVKNPAITFKYLSKDGEEGYPGDVTVTATYSLPSRNSLKLEMEATPNDKPTPVNLAQHTYWNLAGHNSGNVLHHSIQISAHHMTATDANLIPTGEIIPVKNTPFDFMQETKIGSRIDLVPGGYDLNYVLDCGEAKSGLKHVAKVKDPLSSRVLNLWTDAPGVQFYTANYVKDVQGKGGVIYQKHAGLCLETQAFPDAVNQQNFPSIVIQPGEKYNHTMLFEFSAD